MRRRALALLLAFPVACTAGSGAVPEVTGPFGARPTVVLPSPDPAGLPAGLPAGPRAEVLTEGGGPELGPDDLAVVHYTAHVWDGGANRLADSTFARGVPTATLPPAVTAALPGHHVGSRLLLTLPPPPHGAGPQEADPPRAAPDRLESAGVGLSRLGSSGVAGERLGAGPGSTLLYVVDILGKHAAGASLEADGGELHGVRVSAGARPGLKVPEGTPPDQFAARVLSRGRGPAVEQGRLLVAQYEAVVWGSGRSAGSTWRAGRPAAFTVGDGSVIAGWDRALLGVPAGSRVLMVVPPADAYGTTGHPPLGIRPGETLVYVMDVLAAY